MDGAAIRDGRDGGTTETESTMLDGLYRAAAALAHSAGARSVTTR
jgi:hypothetical protein